jgi:sulfate/thiosulfate transport system substrate-binding protein
MTRRLTAALVAALSLVAAVAIGCGGSGSGGDESKNLSLVAYSTPKEAYEGIIPAFEKTPDGNGIEVGQSYGSSGDQERAVESGLDADVVALSLEPDVTKLVDKDLVAPDWKKDKYKGFVTKSVVVFVTRKGNPKRIHTWADLTKPGVEVITPNPLTSGGARWNVMAAYGAQLEQGKSEQEAVDYLKALFKNVPVQDKSARESLQTFDGGKGDVLIAYENEAITAQQKGLEVDYTVPEETILIENPIAVTKQAEPADKAQAFVDFARSAEGQKIFVAKGYRPVRKGNYGRTFPTPPKLFTIAKFGGWEVVSKKFFDPEKGVTAEINRSLGKPTE